MSAAFVRQSRCTTPRLGFGPLFFFKVAHQQAVAARILYAIKYEQYLCVRFFLFNTSYFQCMVYALQQQHEVKTINTCDSDTRARAISTRTRFVVNRFRLIGDPFFAGGHDTGTL